MIITRDSLGVGIYTPEEAAFYARVSPQLMNRWIFAAGGKSVIKPQIEDQPKSDRIVTFLDMIQALAIRDIRNTYKITLEKIRQAVEFVQRQTGVKHPFAMRHMTYIVSDRQHKGHGEIIIRITEIDGDETKFIQASGKASGNFVIRPVVEMYMDELTYDNEGLAEEYRPLAMNGERILLTPHRRFGEPIVESCGYTAETLWEAAINEGSVDAAAMAFGVPESAVRIAYKYYDHLSPKIDE